MNQELLSADRVERGYRSRPVLRGVSLRVERGERILLVGQNGAGKSTLLKVFAGLLRPSSGAIRRAETLSLGYFGHQGMLYGELTVAENLRLFCELAGLGVALVPELVRRWGLQDHEDSFYNDLSKGLQARCALARTFLAGSPIILLDEPSSALDDAAAELLGAVVQEESAKGTSFLIATHDLARLGPLATRVIVLAEGLIHLDSSAAGTGGVSAAFERYRSLNR